MSNINFNIIVCYCNKNGIGRENTIPWRISDDLKHFKLITTGQNEYNLPNTVIMGRKTWESLPRECRPLKDRYNIVLSSKKNFQDSDRVHYINSNINATIDYINELNDKQEISNNVFIIGGEEIYKQFMENYIDLIDKIYVTELYSTITCDKYFPKIDTNKFKITKVSEFKKDKSINYRYLTYQKRTDMSKYINKEEQQYIDLIDNILQNGLSRDDRTGEGTISIFAPYTMKFNLNDTFPLCTLKKGFFRAVFEELMLYIRGQTDNGILQEKNIHIWDGNTTREFLDKRGLTELPEGDMGETYGFNMRHYGGNYVNCKTKYDKKNGFDQLEYVINEIKHNPYSRRILINLWNPKTAENAALPSCLHQYQFYVDTKNKTLNLQIYLRSSDVFLANNWNACTGALFVHLLCNLKDINLTPGILSMVCGDAHIYKNHIELSKQMITRESYPYGKLIVKKKVDKIEEFTYEDINIIGYKSHPNDLKGKMAV